MMVIEQNIFKDFPIGKKRKEVIEQNKKQIADFKITGRDKILKEKCYSWVDSPLDGGSSIPYESRGQPFASSFEHVLPPHYRSSLRKYIEQTLQKVKGKAVGVEFGGIGSNLSSGFTAGFFIKSIGVTLVDHRDPDELDFIQRRDKKINHQLLEGDIFSTDTYRFLDNLLGGGKSRSQFSDVGRPKSS
jgi:hypothetical protein